MARPSPIVRLDPYMSEKFIVTARLGTEDVKLFQILFNDRHGAVVVSFPYFPITEGIGAEISVPPGAGPFDMNLQEGGKLTSHLVKFSHKPDGRAHFSQDGKVYTEIVRRAAPLKRLDGHCFTMLLRGLSAFEPPMEKERREALAKRSWLILPFPEGDPGWIKVVGYWYTRLQFRRHYLGFAQGGMLGPVMTGKRTDGSRIYRIVITPPNASPSHESVMVIEGKTQPNLKSNDGPMLIFQGGFDLPSKTRDLNLPLNYLAMKYPCEDFEELKQTLPVIDFIPGEQPHV